MKKISSSQMQKLRTLFRKHGILLAYLFGSQARGTAGPMSDVDIAVVFDSEASQKKRRQIESRITGEIRKIFNTEDIDIVDLIETESPLLKYNAVFHGKPILIKAKRTKIALERSIMQEFEDTEHLRNTQRFLLRRRIQKGNMGKAPLLQQKYIQRYVSR